MPDIRYRPAIRRLLEQIIGEVGLRVADINAAKFEDEAGVTRQTIRAWIRADTPDQDLWLTRYDPEVERRLRLFFSELMGQEVQVIERIEVNDADPRFQEAVVAATAA